MNNVRLSQGTDSHHAGVQCLDEGQNRQFTPCCTPRACMVHTWPDTSTACCLCHLSRASFVPALLKASQTLAPWDLRTAP